MRGLTAFHSVSVSGMASASARAAAVMALSSVTVGMMVPVLSVGIAVYLFAICSAQTDDAPSGVTVNKNHDIQR